jgi:hypothetical protein
MNRQNHDRGARRTHSIYDALRRTLQCVRICFAVPAGLSLQNAGSGPKSSVSCLAKPSSPTNPRLMPIPKTAKSTPQRHDEAACLNIPFPLPSRANANACSKRRRSHCPNPLGRSDASAGMISAGPSAPSERVFERSTAAPSQRRKAEDAPAERPDSNRQTARSKNRPQQETPNHREDRAAFWNRRGYDRPVGELGRAYAHDRSRGVKGFWAWSD